jgi:hypothetical protein
MTIERIWERRDLPVLSAIAHATAHQPECTPEQLREAMPDLEEDELKQSLVWLKESGYIEAIFLMADQAVLPVRILGIRLLERGRWAVGAWPREDSYAALLDLLEQRIQAEPEPDRKSKLVRVRDAVVAAGRDVMVDVIAGLVRGAAGLP